jgi:hypothetical protein
LLFLPVLPLANIVGLHRICNFGGSVHRNMAFALTEIALSFPPMEMKGTLLRITHN